MSQISLLTHQPLLPRRHVQEGNCYPLWLEIGEMFCPSVPMPLPHRPPPGSPGIFESSFIAPMHFAAGETKARLRKTDMCKAFQKDNGKARAPGLHSRTHLLSLLLFDPVRCGILASQVQDQEHHCLIKDDQSQVLLLTFPPL